MPKQMFTMEVNCGNIYLLLTHRLLCIFSFIYFALLIRR